jgi:hypothetical protein
MGLTNCDPGEMKSRMPIRGAADLICNCVMAFVLVHAAHYAGPAAQDRLLAYGCNMFGAVDT